MLLLGLLRRVVRHRYRRRLDVGLLRNRGTFDSSALGIGGIFLDQLRRD